MEARANIKYMRYSDRKLRQVADLIRGKSVEESLAVLGIMKNTKKGAVLLEGALKSAVANFQNNDEGHGAASTGWVGISSPRKTAIKDRRPSGDYSVTFFCFESALPRSTWLEPD